MCLGLKRVDMVVWWSGMLRGRVEVGWVFRVSEKMKILEVLGWRDDICACYVEDERSLNR